MAGRASIDRSSSEIDTPSALPGQNAKFTSSPLAEPNNVDNTVPADAELDHVLRSDIGVNTLLSRLKQSIASARDFASFLKKRSALEEKHAQGVKDLGRSTSELTRRPESRQGSYAQSHDELNRIHDKMADNALQFALSLHHMHDDLQELAMDKERARKQWKASGLAAEKRVIDAEIAMEKARLKAQSLAEDYDRVRTGDKQSGRFGLKGPKSAAQIEEDLFRKKQSADADHQSKVQNAQSLRRELETTSRPGTVKVIQQLISECDSALTLQIQRYAALNEKLLLSNGLCVSPLKGQDSPNQPRSMREVIGSIDNERDFRTYVLSHSHQVPRRAPEPSREKPQPAVPPLQTTPQYPLQPPFPSNPVQQQYQSPASATPDRYQPYSNPVSAQSQPPDHSDAFAPPGAGAIDHGPSYAQRNSQQFHSQSGPNSPTQATFIPYNGAPAKSGAQSGPPPAQYDAKSSPHPLAQPVFGVSLEELYGRDGSAVPMVIYQCLQAINLFGLDAEGIYRQSGSANHIQQLKQKFDTDPSSVDFRNPESFYHDVHSVAGLLKLFLRELPDPLFTVEHYQSFIEAARIDDDIARRDSLHASINSLPDPHYATLRALSLHLFRVQEHFHVNRMNAGNLAICLGPTLMGSSTGPNIADAGWQVRVIDTILQNTYQIFDDDD